MRVPGQINRTCCFVDDFNLPDNCDLWLIPVETIASLERHYRLRLTEDYEPLVSTDPFIGPECY